MVVHNRRLKVEALVLDGNQFDRQLNSMTLDPGQEDGDVQYTFDSLDPSGDGGSFVEETDDKPTLELHFFADWRSNEISDWLWANRRRVVPFSVDHYPNIVGEHVRWSGRLTVKAPQVGGDARTTEMSQVTLQIDPTSLDYERIG